MIIFRIKILLVTIGESSARCKISILNIFVLHERMTEIIFASDPQSEGNSRRRKSSTARRLISRRKFHRVEWRHLSRCTNNVFSRWPWTGRERKLVERKPVPLGNWFRCAIRGTRLARVIELSNTNASYTLLHFAFTSHRFEYIPNASFRSRRVSAGTNNRNHVRGTLVQHVRGKEKQVLKAKLSLPRYLRCLCNPLEKRERKISLKQYMNCIERDQLLPN